ncbi:MAG: hypothetical protein CYPHOPRED_005534 [Cyphobasidiales sp. Tagirdzhanova-0007]|nr:MAG: hypothetical protein CYPHOPRED_005534 [Cyphobasidiales sp. Tagirdzhanova-0007]
MSGILPRPGTTFELEDSPSASESDAAAPAAIDLEARSRSVSVAVQDETPSESLVAEVTNRSRRREKVKLAACYWSLAAMGEFGKFYDISYMTVATMFVGYFVGYTIAGLVFSRATSRYGLGKVITVGAVFQMLGYCVFVAPPPFPVFPVVYVMVGLGVSYQDAGSNVYVAGLSNASIKLGYLHAAYGLGALVAPLVATAFVQNGVQWSRFYAVSIGFTATNVISLVLNFWTDEAEMTNVHHIHSTPIEMEPATLAKIDGDHEDPLDQGQRASEHTLGNASPSVITIGRGAKDEAVTGNRTVWIVCFYLLLCLGAEVTIGGWCVAYVIDTRKGGTSVGYVASGFWAGIALSRALLPRFNLFVGERNVIFLYIGLALALEFLIWFLPNLIANGVAFSLVGFFLGPFFPTAISVLTKLMPKHLHTDESQLIIPD